MQGNIKATRLIALMVSSSYRMAASALFGNGLAPAAKVSASCSVMLKQIAAPKTAGHHVYI